MSREVIAPVDPIEVAGLDAFLTGLSREEPFRRVAIALSWFAWATCDLSDSAFEQMMDYIRKGRRTFQRRAMENLGAEPAQEEEETDAQPRQEIQGSED